MKTRTKVILLGCIGLPVAAVALFGWAAFGDHSEFGFHHPRVEWLPPSASDVSFCRNSNIANVHAYEFRISRADFETLARERNWSVAPIQQEKSVIRYTQCLPHGHPEGREPFYASSSSGLFHEDRRSNGGGITVLYDDATSMAYVFKSNR